MIEFFLPRRAARAVVTCGMAAWFSTAAALAQITAVPEVTVIARPDPVERPTGQTINSVDRDQYRFSPGFSSSQALQYVPGVTYKQGNGPRDEGISIRGSNARNGFGIRNIVILEDGFPVTQPDGLSRTDITDPHAYSSIDVFKGPSSALFGNYATGGALAFHTRRGREVDGFEFGTDAGSFGYVNLYSSFGRAGDDYDGAFFGSHVRGEGFNDHGGFNTTTENILISYRLTDRDTVTAKLVNNDLTTELSTRLSLNQYRQNPYQSGCVTAATAAAGCATVALRTNGFAPATTNQTAKQAGFGRKDRRTIFGLRWEHLLDDDTSLRFQGFFDNKDIRQPTGQTSAVGNSPAIGLSGDVTSRGQLAGLPVTHYVGLFSSYYLYDNTTLFLKPGGNASTGGVSSLASGTVFNMSGRAREEITLAKDWTFTLGVGTEYSELGLNQTNFSYSGASVQSIASQPSVSAAYINVAPEASLSFHPDPAWFHHLRVSTGYGIPQLTQLTTTSSGQPGNNTDLQPQSNLGIDVGTEWTPTHDVTLSVTAFQEFFTNEFVTQSPGAGLSSFTFNAPASEHRGLEVGGEWRFSKGWRLSLAYLLNDQIYTEYSERLSNGAQSAVFNRAGNKIPGVEPNQFNVKLGYDQPDGPLAGLGAYVEANWRDSFYMDNANLLKAPGYELVNLNLHYEPDFSVGPIRRLTMFLAVQNVLDEVYAASANSISNTISAATGQQNGATVLANSGGSIYAGAPRTIVGGVRMKF